MPSSFHPESTGRTALVTGAAGNIGRALCARLYAAGWRVIGLSKSPPVEGGPWHSYVVADLAKGGVDGTVRAIDARIDVVWHLAAKAHALDERHQDPTEYERVNVTGTAHALEIAHRLGGRRFVFASSVKAMGEGGHRVLDETSPCEPHTAYGRAKLTAERLVLSTPAVPEPVVLRFCMVYGGTDRGNMSRMLAAVRAHRFPPFPETGNRRSFVYRNDAVTACVLAGTAAAVAGQVFIVTDGRFYSTRELYLAMHQALGRRPPAFTLPLVCFSFAARVGDLAGVLFRRRAPLESAALAKLTESAAYSSEKISRLLGYVPEWPLARGLAAIAGRDAGKAPA